MIHEHRHLIDLLVWACAGVAAFSLAQAALMVTFIAGCFSIILGSIRLHDRLKYGPDKRR